MYNNVLINRVLGDVSFAFCVELTNTRYQDLHADSWFELQHVKKLKVVIPVCERKN